MQQVLSVRQYRMRCMVQKVDMPDPDQRRHDWQIVLERCVAKVFVHLVCPGQ